MHPQAMHFANRFGTADPIRVIEFGSRDINGTPRGLFPAADWHGLDITDGPGVDEIGDASTWTGEPADLIVCMEVLEHTDVWRQIVVNCAKNLNPGGRVVLTAAGPHRAPHSAVDGGHLRDDEYYANIDPADLQAVLIEAGFVNVEVYEVGADVQATATIPTGDEKPKAKVRKK